MAPQPLCSAMTCHSGCDGDLQPGRSQLEQLQPANGSQPFAPLRLHATSNVRRDGDCSPSRKKSSFLRVNLWTKKTTA
ncbi:unnamed protein product [Caenorhabditis auriculariae]|uniref:Uncharacterized protein n=1 Tax=Caenorhabditis auriculariae TaxID=2777116 RepID=A0A8S1HY99_9PELO|nr:unnamed protein product [Caenorhabditis auriculariae]